MTPLVYIATLNWNNLADTLACLDSIDRLAYPNRRVVVVDNGSRDDSAERLRNDPRISQLIASPVNLGYAGGNNAAIREALTAGADYVWLLNNDTLCGPDTLTRLVDAMSAQPGLGMTSPVLRYPPGDAIEYAGGFFDIATARHCVTSDLDQAQRWQHEHPTAISLFGTALLVRRAVFERVGLLDEDLFAYWEDTDLSIRANAAGFRSATVFDASVLHVKIPPEISEAGRRPHFYYYMTRNEMLLWRKHLTGSLRTKALLWSVLRALRKIDLRPDDPAVGDALLAGIWDGARKRTGEYQPVRRMPQPLRLVLHRTRHVWLKVFGLQPVAPRAADSAPRLGPAE